ncbi:O-antigen/teichoic acid export membrane protein [Pedobacter sp. W3I1]|uniref:hypothetical protein n=1 Tax=Pedobacter sp. W3I1 TaxID=3042291 RepID=UPI0027864E13|nr:hypothetical protein [Pedobacter sp. W3I1]MDQ0637091.1 O-antigen/teichoic acid export membrane protein [Pedobacter sp. W3I1]
MKRSLITSIAGSTSFKLLSAVVSFLTVPLLLKTLGTDSYAIWVTTTALVAWLNLFDFGSGYSLKNKVTESIALDNYTELNGLIAGTIQFYLLMSLGILLVFIGSLFVVSVFKANLILALVLYLPIIFSFPLTLGHFIIQGRKKFNTFNFLLLFQSIVWLVIVMFFRYGLFSVSLYTLATLYSGLFFVTNLMIMIYSLKGIGFKVKEIFNFKHIVASKESLKVGYRFFLLQVSSLFLFSLGNILTYDHLTLSNVAQFDTVNKIYLMGMTVFNVVISVYWAEISHAKATKDKKVLNKLFNQLLLIAIVFCMGTLIFTFFIPFVIEIWTKKMIKVELFQLYPFVILVCVQALAYAGATILNAFENLKGQIILAVMAALFIIPLAKFLFTLNVGIGTVPLSSAILLVPSAIFVIYKARAIINNVS